MGQKKVFGEVYQVVLLNNLNDITLKTGMMFGVITLDTSKEEFNVGVEKSHAQNINNKLHEIIYEAKANATNTQQIISQPQKSIVEELKELKELLDIGILTNEEFNTQKTKILNS